MSKVKVVLNSASVRALLKSSGAADICMEQARRIQGNAGEHYAVEVRAYPERTGAAVYPWKFVLGADEDGEQPDGPSQSCKAGDPVLCGPAGRCHGP